jgi:hypothetical protein
MKRMTTPVVVCTCEEAGRQVEAVAAVASAVKTERQTQRVDIIETVVAPLSAT